MIKELLFLERPIGLEGKGGGDIVQVQYFPSLLGERTYSSVLHHVSLYNRFCLMLG